ncbi:C40 family peptidase [Mycolicibacterium pulveris]|uniref:C40 family peptidase n=1 Tax=Mycolicibacterium pulveris TaxID=36813 RepID=UPI003CEEEC72
MPTALVAALSAPIRELAATVGPGWPDEPSAVLHQARDALADVAAAARRSWQQTGESWSGAGADGAADFTATMVAAIDGLADHIDRMGTAARTAAEAVAHAHHRLQAIVDDFEARAAALEPFLDSPGMAEKLLAEARRALQEAVAVVEQLETELDGHVATVSAPAAAPSAPAAPASTSPAGIAAPALPAMGGGTPSSGLGGALGELASLSRPESAAPVPDAATFGDGVAVRLPDGSTAMAPNAVAASAVRHALTQLGVPYEWGGTTPGVGLDCSGLTQWAYSEAGLAIPRLAQEQDVGAAVDAGSLRPGDLAVWDGHVAMIVGNGTMIEAGDPVKLSPIRTDNAGQGFQGFWRPTA